MDGFAGDLVFMLNGREVRLDHVDPTTLLVDYLRSADVGLTGTKWVCRQGGCGACTVMLSHNHGAGKTVHAAINSCLRPLASYTVTYPANQPYLDAARKFLAGVPSTFVPYAQNCPPK